MENDKNIENENLVETNLRMIPDSYDKYDIKIDNDFFERDDEVLKRLHDAGFTQKQAQLVYDLAQDKVLPMIGELTIDFEAQKQLEKLVAYFGSKEKFDEVARQVSVWARQNMKPELYNVLGSTYEGVIALYKMMSSNEPMLDKSEKTSEEFNEVTLKEMMKDPRYWQTKDASYIEKIRKGFEKLYPTDKE